MLTFSWPWSYNASIICITIDLLPCIVLIIFDFFLRCCNHNIYRVWAGVHVFDPRRRDGVGRADVPGLQWRREGDVEQGVRRLQQLLPEGDGFHRHHLWGGGLLRCALSALLPSSLQHLRSPPPLRRTNWPGDRRLPPLT